MTDETTSNAPSTTAESSNPQKTNYGLVVAILITALAVAAAIYWFGSGATGLSGNGSVDTLGGANQVESAPTSAAPSVLSDTPDVVATVNGVEINKATVAENIAQTEARYAQQGLDPTDPAVAEEMLSQALENAINTEVLTQAAAEAGTRVTDDAVATEFEAIVGQFPDEAAFAAELEAAGLTRDALREDIRERLVLDTYVTAAAELETLPAVTEAEARAFYDQAVAQSPGAPAFAEVRPQIEAQLVQQNQQEVISALITELREAAEIEVLI